MAKDVLLFDALDEGIVTEVIRPAAIMPEAAARQVLSELAMRDVRADGVWHTTPTLWRLYDRPWTTQDTPGEAQLMGSLQVAYGTPTRYEITIYRCTITLEGQQAGWHVQRLTNEALGYGGLDLATCPRAQLTDPPQRFRMR
jgi:hypothetical protein